MSDTKATLWVHPLCWLLSNNRLEEVCGTLTKGTFSSRLLLSNQDKGCTLSVAHSLPLPLPPGFCSTCLVLFTRSYCYSWVRTKHFALRLCERNFRTANQKLPGLFCARFQNYQHFFENDASYSKFSKVLRNSIRIKVGQAVLDLLIKQYFKCFDLTFQNTW